MFGHLSFSPDGYLLVTYPMWNLRAPVVISQAGRLKRAGLMTRMSALPGGEGRNRLYLGISAALTCVPDDFVDYAIDIGMTYFQLPAAELDKRTRDINAAVDAQFDATDVKAHADVAAIVKCLKAVGYLHSGPDLDMFVQHWCTSVREELWKSGPMVAKPLKAAMNVLTEFVARAKDPLERKALHSVATNALTSACPSELAALQDAYQSVASKANGGAVMIVVDNTYSTSTLSTPSRAAALRDALVQVAADPKSSAAAVAQTAFARASVRLEEEDEMTVRISVQAIEAGQAVGEFTATSRQALERVNASRLVSEQNALQTLLRLGQRERHQHLQDVRSGPATPSVTLSAGGETETVVAERDALQRLSLGQLLRWIEGPVTGARRRPLDRAAALAKARARRPAPAQPVGNPAPAAIAPPHEALADLELSALDIAAVAAQGYAAAATFLRDEIFDMLPVAEQLKLNTDVMAQATTLAHSLEQLRTALEIALDRFDEEATQLELSKAEAALATLREQLAQQKQSVQRKTQFMDALSAALSREELRMDRRDGGVIACPLQPTDWGWVADLCHRRWLSSVRRIQVDGLLTDLGSNEALALHVTGSSRSSEAYLFNVSVHLWRRDHGSAGLPSAVEGPWSPMNTEVWFDTYRTCCVLHVPRG